MFESLCPYYRTAKSVGEPTMPLSYMQMAQQLPTLLAQERWKLLRPRVGCGVQTNAATSQQCWDLQCIVGTIQPTRLF